ncbi:hypothetical protein [Mesobacillus maritimus]|uniref:hypothetical protein n=1 Tax=Mesobacillus maritimus TaxID=1643336 RepID=UPI00384FC776
MYWESLPSWIWVIYYLFLFATLGTAIMNLKRKKMIYLSMITIVLTITVPIISLTNSIGRLEGVNEFEHLVAQLQQGSIWSFYVVLGFIYLFVYWVMLIFKNKLRTEVTH